MNRVKCLSFYAFLLILISSNALSQPGPKIGVVAKDFFVDGHLVPIKNTRDFWRFEEMATGLSKNIVSNLKSNIEGAYVAELPFRYGWTLEAYRKYATEMGLDILLFYDFHELSSASLSRTGNLLDGKLMLLQTGEIWGRSSAMSSFVRKEWIAKLSTEIGKAVSVWYHIRSVPSKQICLVDGAVQGLTPKDFSAFRVLGSTTSIEVYFDEPKEICRRKDAKIEHREQIIKETFKPRDPEKPSCQYNKSRK